MPRNESEPRSNVYNDLGGGLNTLHNKGYIPRPNPAISEHEKQARMTRQPILEPTAEDLAQLSDEQKKETSENIRKIKEAYIAGTLGEISFSGASTAELDEPNEPQQPGI